MVAHRDQNYDRCFSVISYLQIFCKAQSGLKISHSVLKTIQFCVCFLSLSIFVGQNQRLLLYWEPNISLTRVGHLLIPKFYSYHWSHWFSFLLLGQYLGYGSFHCDEVMRLFCLLLINSFPTFFWQNAKVYKA